MVNDILHLFPPHTHPLTLVSDPDGLLNGEATRVILTQGGFSIIQEIDPILLRRRISEMACPSMEHPLVVITSDPIEMLPYDLWQNGYKIQLSLHQYFPNLSYPVLQTLSPSQIVALSQVPQPDAPLGRQKTIEFLLKEIFHADLTHLNLLHQLIGWLIQYHQSGSPMPALLQDYLVDRLRRITAFKDIDQARWISDSQAFSADLQSQWAAYVQTGSQRNLGEGKGKYHIPFEDNQHLQELVPDLVRKRVIQPVEITPDSPSLPEWAAAGLTQRNARLEQIQYLFDGINQQLPTLAAANWDGWKQAARQWADLNVLLFSGELPSARQWQELFHTLSQAFDKTFLGWLQTHYALLGAQRLPRPSHVHHIPHFLAYQRGLESPAASKVALIILDGMSLIDWSVIQAQWSQRNLHWKIQTDLLLAQIPTITALSRYALISGLRPADFANHLDTYPSEEKKWQLFWMNEGLAANTIGFSHLALDRTEAPTEIESGRIQALCLIDDTLDRLTHNATLGAADQQASLRLWLDAAYPHNSVSLEHLITQLLDRQFTVYLASDHGHVEATGFGQPSEGLVAQTRGKRARIYQDRNAALRVQMAFPETILWENDGLNPTDLFALMPTHRKAFAPNGEVAVTHGGISPDEVIVPFIHIEQKA